MSDKQTIIGIDIKAKDYKVGDWLLNKDEIISVKHLFGVVLIKTQNGREEVFLEDEDCAKWAGEEWDYSYYKAIRDKNGKFLYSELLEGKELIDRIIEVGKVESLLPVVLT